MTSQDLIASLLKQADKDFQIAKELFKNKRYSYCLFFCQLALEKLLKGLIVKKTKKIYPPIHSLVRLSNLAKIKLTNKQEEELEEISAYNIKARYDDIKLSFYKKANQAYTKKWFDKVVGYIKWLKKQY